MQRLGILAGGESSPPAGDILEPPGDRGKPGAIRDPIQPPAANGGAVTAGADRIPRASRNGGFVGIRLDGVPDAAADRGPTRAVLDNVRNSAADRAVVRPNRVCAAPTASAARNDPANDAAGDDILIVATDDVGRPGSGLVRFGSCARHWP